MSPQREIARHCIHMYIAPSKKHSYKKKIESESDQAPVSDY